MSLRGGSSGTVFRRLGGAVVAVALLAGVPTGGAAPPPATHDGLEPQDAAEGALAAALARYRAIARRGGWPALPAGPVLRAGDSGAAIATLRRRLAATGDLDPADPVFETFDAALDTAVRRFQHRHGLTVDGLVGPATRAALNRDVSARIRTLAINLQRSRRSDRSVWASADRYVLINLPAFALFAVEDGRTRVAMRVIVGKPRMATPTFTASITGISFNPSWVVPPRIARKELLPVIRANVDFLATRKFTVFDSWAAAAPTVDPKIIDWSRVTPTTMRYRLRQEPGPLNPLGQLKFLVADSGGIYLHDTPARRLFDHPLRAFSHGCIRLERPLELAMFAMRGMPGWTREDIESAARGGVSRIVPLARPIPVRVVYRTAWVDGDGTVNFRPDIYGQDSKESIESDEAERAGCAAE